MTVADVTWVGSVAGALSPVLSLVLIWMLRWAMHGKLNNIEKGLSEVETEVIKEIQNGVTERLDTVLDKQDEAKKIAAGKVAVPVPAAHREPPE